MLFVALFSFELVVYKIIFKLCRGHSMHVFIYKVYLPSSSTRSPESLQANKDFSNEK